MAPEFFPGFARAVLGIYLAYVIALVVVSTVAIYVLGRIAGRVFPPVRHVAPLAFGALAAWLSPVRDGRLLALWVAAGVIGAIDAVLRDASRRYPPPGPRPPAAPTPEADREWPVPAPASFPLPTRGAGTLLRLYPPTWIS